MINNASNVPFGGQGISIIAHINVTAEKITKIVQ